MAKQFDYSIIDALEKAKSVTILIALADLISETAISSGQTVIMATLQKECQRYGVEGAPEVIRAFAHLEREHRRTTHS
ncbi:hypothetical protein KW798_02700 [Candidatus Parcubacteria bacterium]|nr:hypothetical protein [Candidatus Parcubacteria bacterium]